MKEKHTVIIDQIGRTILGVETSQSDTKITMDNPIILHFQPAQNGSLELQVFPLFFFELLNKEKRNQNSWTWDKSSVAVSNVELEDGILTRYAQINTPPVAAPPVSANPKVISIDDL